MRCEVCGDRVFQPDAGKAPGTPWLHMTQLGYLRRGFEQHHAVPVQDTHVEIEKLALWAQ